MGRVCGRGGGPGGGADVCYVDMISDLPNLDPPEFEARTIFTEASLVLIETGLIRETGLTLL